MNKRIKYLVESRKDIYRVQEIFRTEYVAVMVVIAAIIVWMTSVFFKDAVWYVVTAAVIALAAFYKYCSKLLFAPKEILHLQLKYLNDLDERLLMTHNDDPAYPSSKERGHLLDAIRTVRQWQTMLEPAQV